MEYYFTTKGDTPKSAIGRLRTEKLALTVGNCTFFSILHCYYPLVGIEVLDKEAKTQSP